MIITAGRILHPYLIYITHGLLSSSFTLLNTGIREVPHYVKLSNFTLVGGENP